MKNVILQCADNPNDFPVDAFCTLLDEFVRLLSTFGKAMYYAFEDVSSKSEDMRKNRDFLASELGKPANMSL